MEEPYRENGVADATEVEGYQILTPISQNSSSESDYDYPRDANDTTFLLPVSEVPAAARKQLQGQASRSSKGNAPRPPGDIMELEATKRAQPTLDNASLVEGGGSSSSSEGDSSDAGKVTIVKQVPLPTLSSRPTAEHHGDEKLYITGNLMENDPSIFFKTGTGTAFSGEFADEGIYQGLIMTDKQKNNIGILPESIYMTTNLLEKGDLIESMSLLDTSPAVAVEVPEVPLPPSSPPIFSKDSVVDTVPKNAPPKPPRRERGKDKLLTLS
jgi:hypothetical protein